MFPGNMAIFGQKNSPLTVYVVCDVSYILLYCMFCMFDNFVRWSYGLGLLANHPGDGDSPHSKSITRSIRHSTASQSSREVHVIVSTEHVVGHDMNSFAHESISSSLHVDPNTELWRLFDAYCFSRPALNLMDFNCPFCCFPNVLISEEGV